MPSLMKFPSAEWAAALYAALNANAEYAEAARQWEGDILLRVTAASAGGVAPGVHLELEHGACRGATFEPDSSAVSSEFVFEGSAENWGKLIRREVDPVGAIMNGTIRVKGNLAKLMRFTRAAKILVETAGAIPVDP